MKRALVINRIIWALLFAATIVTLVIIYKDLDTPFTFKFIVGYTVSLLLFSLYYFVVIVLNLRQLNWVLIRKRISRFVLLFVMYSAFGWFYNYFFKETINYYNIFSISLGLSFGMTFYDLVLSNNTKDE